MSDRPTPESGGTEQLAHDLRDEASSLVHHPGEEMKRLTQVAADGKSGTTPLLVAIGVIGVVGLILVVVLGVASLAYYLT